MRFMTFSIVAHKLEPVSRLIYMIKLKVFVMSTTNKAAWNYIYIFDKYNVFILTPGADFTKGLKLSPFTG